MNWIVLSAERIDKPIHFYCILYVKFFVCEYCVVKFHIPFNMGSSLCYAKLLKTIAFFPLFLVILSSILQLDLICHLNRFLMGDSQQNPEENASLTCSLCKQMGKR